MTITLEKLKASGNPETWLCIDCGANTAPGNPTRAEIAAAFSVLSVSDGVNWEADERSEIYCVRKTVWEAAGIRPMAGCLCIGCLESRLGRRLKPKDFARGHAFNDFPGTDRLLDRRGNRRAPSLSDVGLATRA